MIALYLVIFAAVAFVIMGATSKKAEHHISEPSEKSPQAALLFVVIMIIVFCTLAVLG
jgi:Na+-translocating ferredoxin:NAD+ oxidoreductase RnfG subunit